MKKIFMLMIFVVVVLLTACTDTGGGDEIPNIDDFDEVELSLSEKVDFLADLDLSNVSSGAFSYNAYFKGDLDIDFINNNDYFYETNNSRNKIKGNFDFDSTIYATAGETINDIVLYAELSKLVAKLDVLNESEVINDDEPYYNSSYKEENNIDISINNSFVLVLGDNAYFRLNGSVNVEADYNGETETNELSFDNIKERMENLPINNEGYDELKEELDNLTSMYEDMFNEIPDLTEFEEMLEDLNNLVTIYKKGDVHIIELKIDVDKLLTAIDETLGMFIGVEEGEVSVIFTEMMDLLTEHLKTFDFEVKIEVHNNKVTKLGFDFKMELTNIEYSYEDDDFDVLNQVNFSAKVKIDRLGFLIDFNPKAPSYPSQDDLNNYELVDEPSFGDLFN